MPSLSVMIRSFPRNAAHCATSPSIFSFMPLSVGISCRCCGFFRLFEDHHRTIRNHGPTCVSSMLPEKPFYACREGAHGPQVIAPDPFRRDSLGVDPDILLQKDLIHFLGTP